MCAATSVCIFDVSVSSFIRQLHVTENSSFSHVPSCCPRYGAPHRIHKLEYLLFAPQHIRCKIHTDHWRAEYCVATSTAFHLVRQYTPENDLDVLRAEKSLPGIHAEVSQEQVSIGRLLIQLSVTRAGTRTRSITGTSHSERQIYVHIVMNKGTLLQRVNA